MDVTPAFEAEIARLRQAGVPGATGRLRDLFDWLAARGNDAPSASQTEIAAGVFGDTSTDADDATVRVYVHRLRKKIEDHYAVHPARSARIELPAGTYALRLVSKDVSHEATQQSGLGAWRLPVWLWLALAAGLIGVLFAAQKFGGSDRPNAIWQQLLQSDRPVLLVVGDYYIFGEIDPVRPEQGRLIRDFRVNSAEDLIALQEAEPERYRLAEDQGLNYLPVAAANALASVAPLLADAGKQVEVIPASSLEPAMLGRYDIVYIGLLSGMGLLEDANFAGSTFAIGESYDELRDRTNARTYISGEARSLASPAFYRDYGYLAQAQAPGGAQMVVIAGFRDTGLRATANLAAASDLPERFVAADENGVEALVQVTGQQGADLSSRVIVSRARPVLADPVTN